MNGYVNPAIVLLPDPAGVDLAIQEAQIVFTNNLGWLQKSFGRAILQVEVTQETDERGNTRRREIVYPEVYGPEQEPLNVMPNDNLTSYSFWWLRDPTQTQDYDPLSNQVFINTPVSIIFWFNLRKIDPAKNYRFTENLKIQVLQLIQKKIPDLTVTDVWERYERVFDAFTITDTHRQYLKPPFGAFRIDCDLRFPLFPEFC